MVYKRRFGQAAQWEGVAGQGSALPLISPVSNTMAIDGGSMYKCRHREGGGRDKVGG